MIQVNFLRTVPPPPASFGRQLSAAAVLLVAALGAFTAYGYLDLRRLQGTKAAATADHQLWQESQELTRQERQLQAATAAPTAASAPRWGPLLAKLPELGQGDIEWLQVAGQGQELTLTLRASGLAQVALITEKAAALPGVADVQVLRVQQEAGTPVAADPRSPAGRLRVEVRVQLRQEGVDAR